MKIDLSLRQVSLLVGLSGAIYVGSVKAISAGDSHDLSEANAEGLKAINELIVKTATEEEAERALTLEYCRLEKLDPESDTCKKAEAEADSK